ncbi:MAG TPA: glycoside hydrolase family 127 protein [Bryobacteraceae bacterium]|nr:glycoside hydrolase family 127 protein [Bryobacteraceae bacterium]
MKADYSFFRGGACLLLALPMLWSQTNPSPKAADLQRDYPIKPVPFTAVHVHDEFWSPRLEINRKVSIPTAFQQCERTGRIENFVRAAEVLRGENLQDKHPPGYPFDDTDAYKVIEGASYTLAVHPDPKLEAYVDSLIAKIAAAQEPDGYLYTTRTIDPQHPHPWAGTQRWQNEEVLSHELYDLGHLYEAAVAYYQATGKRSLLDVAIKSANLLVRTFGPGKRKIYSGHQIVEMGLAKLYRVTGDEQYLTLAKFFLDCRGGGKTYNQADVPVIDQTEPEGHAVRATYMYSGMADVAALTGDKAYLHAIDEIWNNLVEKKIYVTGGIGAIGAIEGFGADYQLPNMSAYNETCAAVGEDFWNQRLFLLNGDARYIDVFERTLYNGLLSGVSLDGETYFYPNPLESIGQHRRSPWFGVACCPGNITRFMPSVPGYVYAEHGDALYVNLFMSNNAEIKLDSGRTVNISQETRYPWDGNIKITLNPEGSGPFTMKVRVPGWARGEAIPGGLYRFENASSDEPPQLRVNGHHAKIELEKGYATITRNWRPGDTIELSLPMSVRRVLASQQVAADTGRVALERGPIVYCLEWPDSPDKHVRNILLTDRDNLRADWKPDLLNGVEVVQANVVAYRYGKDKQLEHSQESVAAIPYYAWANRGQGQMEVWIADQQAAVHPTPYPTLASTSKITASGEKTTPNGIKDPGMVADLEVPTASNDPASSYNWWPHKGTQEWIEYDFAKPAEISQSAVYWFADLKGETKPPASWRLLYREGDEWKPVEAAGSYGLALDQFNEVKFKPVRTQALRLELQLQPNESAGIEEWTVQ